MNAIKKTQNAGNPEFHFDFDVSPGSIGWVASEIFACATMKFMVYCVRSVLHRSTQSPTASGNIVVRPRSSKISSCELRRKAKLNKRDERTLFRAACRLPHPVACLSQPESFIRGIENNCVVQQQSRYFRLCLDSTLGRQPLPSYVYECKN
jgi:hypothetical protein